MGVALVFAVIVFVPPLRRATANGASKVILFVAAPLAPNVSNFNRASGTTRIVASDGSTIAELTGGEALHPPRPRRRGLLRRRGRPTGPFWAV